MRRLISATLLLYPRGVRRSHGPELASLVEELIERDGASRPFVMTRMALDGLTQRLTTRATAVVLASTLALTSIGGLAVSDFAAASAHDALPAHVTDRQRVHAPATRTEVHRDHDLKAHHAVHRSAGIIK